MLGWLHAIEAFQENGHELPVNLKFVIEGNLEFRSIRFHYVEVESMKMNFHWWHFNYFFF